VRISLVDQEKKKRRRKRRKASKTYETAIAFPRTRGRHRPEKRGFSARQRGSRAERPAAAEPSVARRRIPWRQIWKRVPVLFVLAGLMAAIIYASTAEEFFVYEAQITGARYLERAKIYQAAEIDELNIFWIQPEKVAGRIRQLDGIKAVHVNCGLPARVAIEVEEREPVLMWRALSQGRDWWLDEEGVVLLYHGDAHASDALFVVDSSNRQLEVGDQIEPDGIVQSVLQLAAALPEIQIFYFEEGQGLSFTHKSGEMQWPVIVGDSKDLQRKIQAVHVLTGYLLDKNIRARYVDVRRSDYPVYGKPIGESTTGSQ
jgi:cell division septal protein FtsQ